MCGLFFTHMNEGKRFELNIKKSIPEYALIYKLPDPAQSFGGGGKNTRFSKHNPFDFLIWEPNARLLFALEAKTVCGKSISFERQKGEVGEIHYYQIEGLNEWNKYRGTVCGFIIEFREISTTVFIDIDTFNQLIKDTNKKSFNYDDLKNSGLSFLIIPQKKKRTQFTYDMNNFLTTIGEKENENDRK